MTAPLTDRQLAATAKRALDALEDLIADSRDPGTEALGARYELAHALGKVSPYEMPLDEDGFSSQRMEAENYRKLFRSARDRADNLAERVADLTDDFGKLTVQRCPAGKHADWAADSENTHACPWCEIERLHADRAAVRAAAIREAADALLRVDPVEWALAGQHAGNDAADLLRRLAAAPTTTTTPEEH